MTWIALTSATGALLTTLWCARAAIRARRQAEAVARRAYAAAEQAAAETEQP